MSGFDRLNKEVVSIGLCTDCGTCAGVCPSGCLEMDYDLEEPRLVKPCPDAECDLCEKVCPGKNIPMLDMERTVFGRERGAEEMLLGIGRDFVKCHAADPEVRERGGGGGVVSALLIHALESGVIDAAVVVGMSREKPWVAVPVVATSRSEILAAAQAKESMVPVNSILGEAVSRGFKRLGVVGLPCHVHGTRKAEMLGQPEWAREAISLRLGLFCGQNYSHFATEHIIGDWAEVPLEQVGSLEYRKGPYPGLFTVTTRDGEVIVIPIRAQHSTQQGFEHDRCLVCYDYANELADIAVGDYFGMEMTRGVPGESTAIVRSEIGEHLFESALANRCIVAEPVEMEDFYRGGFELKKHGGAYHVYRRRQYGLPCPECGLPMDFRSLPRDINLSHPLIG